MTVLYIILHIILCQPFVFYMNHESSWILFYFFVIDRIQRTPFSTSDLTFVFFFPQNKKSTFWLTEKSQVLAWDRGWNKILFFRYCKLMKKKKTHTHTRVFVIMLLIKCLLAARIWWSIIHFIIHAFILWQSDSWFWWWKTLSLKWESIKLWTMSCPSFF